MFHVPEDKVEADLRSIYVGNVSKHHYYNAYAYCIPIVGVVYKNLDEMITCLVCSHHQKLLFCTNFMLQLKT